MSVSVNVSEWSVAAQGASWGDNTDRFSPGPWTQYCRAFNHIRYRTEHCPNPGTTEVTYLPPLPCFAFTCLLLICPTFNLLPYKWHRPSWPTDLLVSKAENTCEKEQDFTLLHLLLTMFPTHLFHLFQFTVIIKLNWWPCSLRRLREAEQRNKDLKQEVQTLRDEIHRLKVQQNKGKNQCNKLTQAKACYKVLRNRLFSVVITFWTCK